MNTPIYDFVRSYAASDISRLHMPGHKGTPFLGCEPLDITEVKGADDLHSAEGIILESEKNAAALFGTAHTFYSTEGSTLGIKTMLALVAASARANKERPLILAARNAHKAFVNASALLDLDVEWLYPEDNGSLCACPISPFSVERKLKELSQKPSALYITSPDYLGNIADVAGLAKVAHNAGIPLLVDNAHGAYLKFLTPSLHPIDLGADICCDSAHKTLPCLTGGAYLHISKNTAPEYLEAARNMMSVFATTSPSYLILQSLDLCNAYLADIYPKKLAGCIKTLDSLKETLSENGFGVELTEPLKLVINAASVGYSGYELAESLREGNIEPEFSDREHLVLMATPQTSAKDIERLKQTLGNISPREPIALNTPPAPRGAERVTSIREAIFAPSELVPTHLALGRVCGAPTVSCPPAIPIAVSGERISEEMIALFLSYGIESVRVLK